MTRWRLAALAAVLLGGTLTSSAPAGAVVGRITEFQMPTPGNEPDSIVTGPDGALWYTVLWTRPLSNDKVGRITPDGRITEFVLKYGDEEPHGIAAGPDGNLWVTLRKGNKILRLNTQGAVTGAFPVPPRPSGEDGVAPVNANPDTITPGPDGNLWFTQRHSSQIGRITPAGVIDSYPLSGPPRATGISHTEPHGIAVGPDGNMWFTELLTNRIGRMTTGGQLLSYHPTNGASYSIAKGPDARMWFTECGVPTEGRPEGDDCSPDGADVRPNHISRITTSGQVDRYDLPDVPSPPPETETPDGDPMGITAGADGALWFSQPQVNRIGRITTDGVFRGSFLVPTPESRPLMMTTGPDGQVWFVENTGNRVGRIEVHQGASTVVPAFGVAGSTVTVSATGTIPNTSYRVRLGADGASCASSGLLLGGPVVATAEGTIPPVQRIVPASTAAGRWYLCFVPVGAPQDAIVPVAFLVTKGTTSATPATVEPGDGITVSAVGAPVPGATYHVRLGAGVYCHEGQILPGGPVVADSSGTIPSMTLVIPTSTASGSSGICFTRVGDPTRSTTPAPLSVV